MMTDHDYTDDTAKANPPIPLLLDTVDKQTAIVNETVHQLAERIDKALRPSDDVDPSQTVPRNTPRGGSNLAIRLEHISSNLGELGLYLTRLMARIEL